MPPSTQRRRRTQNAEEAGTSDRRRRPRRAPESDEGSDGSDNEDNNQDVDMDRPAGANDTTDDQLVKKLVRYALACEYARIPIKRDGIRDKVLGTHARSFKRVFEAAQEKLQVVFGMQMVELPVREKRTLKEKQKAIKRSDKAPASSRQYVLISFLPKEYRSQSIIGPSRIPSMADEAAYVGFYTLIITLITLSGGELSDMKLKRYLTRLNASQNLPMDKTENVLQKLVRQGYLDRVVEKVEGEEDTVTWCVGPRGKVEITPHNMAQVITEIWREPDEEFDKKLERSLGVSIEGMTQAPASREEAVEEEDG
ncbi:MAGE-domain-containing protein [Xylariaceae sp. FL0594]|nr:MAGE-domain-containing protein [Xylariaceae sp. FL0594]